MSMEDMREIIVMLRSMKEQQEQLLQKVNEQHEEQLQKVHEMECRMAISMEEMRSQLRCMNWERLRWRHVDWERIPPDSRERVITFLSVLDIMSLNNALTCHKRGDDEDPRDQLIESYKGAVIPAFDQCRFTDKDNFKGLRWVMKAGVSLQACELVLEGQAGGVVKDADKVLRWLVDNEREDLASVHAMKSSAKDMVKHNEEFALNASTLWVAARRGYISVVRGLMTRGADINKAMDDGTTPLYIASENGHVDVVRVLTERGADINKATNEGLTPLYAASYKGHVEVVRILIERGADINKALNDGRTPLQISISNHHTEIIQLLQLVA